MCSRALRQELRDFVCLCAEKTAASQPWWVLAIPLYHFLWGYSKVCEPPRKESHRNSNWWGTTGLSKAIDNLHYYQGHYG